MSRKNSLINGTLINGVSSVYTSFLIFVLIPVFVENLGIVEYGLIGIVNIFSLLGYISFFGFGMSSTIPKYIAEYRTKNEIRNLNELINSSLILFIFIGLILAVILVPILKLLIDLLFTIPIEYSESFIKVTTILVISYVYQFPLLILKGILQGFLRFDVLQWTLVIVETIRVGIVYFLVTHNYGYEVVIYSNVLAPFVLAIVYYIAIVNVFQEYQPLVFSVSSITKIRKLSAYMFVGRVSGLLYNNTDRFLIGIFLNPAMMAGYDVMLKLPIMINRFFGLAVSAIIPVASSINHEHEQSLIKGLFHRGFRFYFGFVGPIICASFYFSKDFLLLWVGQEFIYLSDLLFYLILWNLTTTFLFGGNILTGLNRGMKEMTVFRIAQAIVKVVSCYLLIDQVNLSAIPFSYLLSALPIIYMIIIFKKTIGYDYKLFFKDIIIILFSGLIPFSIYFSIHAFTFRPDGLLVLATQACLWCIIQWSLIYLLAFDEEDKLTVKNIILRNRKK